MGKVLGLDIGITSVGWGIIDEESFEVIDCGVRLFDERNAQEGNAKRRICRSSRRLKRRRVQRIEDMKNVLINEGRYAENYSKLYNVYDIREKGLNQRLSDAELSAALCNIAKKRGSCLDVVIDENDVEGKGAKNSLAQNTKELMKDNLYICQLQKKRLIDNGKVRGTTNIFKVEDYVKEAEKTLSNQGMSKEANEKILTIIQRKRHFSEGPGSYKSPTPYGRFIKVENGGDENGILTVDLIEKMRGRCSVFPDEFRAPKNALSVSIFNLLNDLNNLTIMIDGVKTKVTTEQKELIINEITKKDCKVTPTKIFKLLGVKKDDVNGCRINAKREPLFEEFKGLQKVKGLELEDKTFADNTENIDRLMDILTKTQVVQERKDRITEAFPSLSYNDILLLTNISGISGYHSLSFKAIYEFNDEMMDTNNNQMQIVTNFGFGKKNTEKYAGLKSIPFDEAAILSPVAKRAHIQALKLVDALREQYGEFTTIVIETPREKNSEEEKQKYAAAQKGADELNKEIDGIILDNGLDPKKINGKTRLKMRLYTEQNCKCAYTGNTIDLRELINDSGAYQIDHILPYSISFDDSYQNKVLVEGHANQIKGNTTPYAYFKSGKAYGRINSYEIFKAHVLSNDNYLKMKKKKSYLLFEEDLNKYDVQKEFINRNLVDTRYSTRSIMNTLQDYFRANEIATNIFTVRGEVTNAFRKRAQYKKDRDFYMHHAIDALIIAGLKKQTNFKELFKLTVKDENTFDKDGVFIDFDADPLEDSRLIAYMKSLKNIKSEDVKFSYKVDKKINRAFSDETIYSTRKVDGVDKTVKKYKDIYGKEGQRLAEKFAKNDTDCILMKRNNPQTFAILEKIYNEYKSATNPFLEYYKATGDYVRKYAKDGNGPIVKSIKYFDGVLNSCLDISKHYNVKNKRVVLLQISPYRTDFYLGKDGIYKFVTVRRCHVRQENGVFCINEKQYENLKKEKGITEEHDFVLSFNRNEIIEISSFDKNLQGIVTERYRFVATNNDLMKVIQVKFISQKEDKPQVFKSIGKNIVAIRKICVSIDGKQNIKEKEMLKLKF